MLLPLARTVDGTQAAHSPDLFTFERVGGARVFVMPPEASHDEALQIMRRENAIHETVKHGACEVTGHVSEHQHFCSAHRQASLPRSTQMKP
jgi:hypothetical protein